MSDDFDWERDSKPADSFDWERDSKPAAPPDVHPLMSAGAGAMQSATLGFFDELKGLEDAALAAPVRAVRKVAGKVPAAGLAATAQLLTRRPSPAATQAALDDSDLSWDQAVKDYRQGRDESRAAFKEAHDAHPNWYTGGEIAGGIAMPIPGTGAVKGLTKLQALGKAVKGGMALGGAYGLGNSEADLTKGDVGRAALDTTVGSALGGLGGAAGEGFGRLASYLAKNASNAVKTFAENRAIKAAGATKAAISRLKLAEELQPVSRYILDNDLLPSFGIGGAEEVSRRAATKAGQAGSNMGEALSGLDALSPEAINPSELADKVQQNVVRPLRNKIGMDDAANTASEYVGRMREMRPGIDASEVGPGRSGMSFSEAEERLKRAIGDKVNFNRDQPEKLEALKRVYGIVKDAIENEADEASPELADQFRKAKRQYGLAKEVQSFADPAAAAELGNRILSPSDYITGAAESAQGGLAHGVPAAIAHKIMREHGSATLARAADRAQKVWANAFLPVLERNPEALGKFGKAIAREYQDHGVESAMGLMHALSLEDPDFDRRQKAITAARGNAGASE